MAEGKGRRGLGFGILDRVLEHPVAERIIDRTRSTARGEVEAHVLKNVVEPTVGNVVDRVVRRRL